MAPLQQRAAGVCASGPCYLPAPGVTQSILFSWCVEGLHTLTWLPQHPGVHLLTQGLIPLVMMEPLIPVTGPTEPRGSLSFRQ